MKRFVLKPANPMLFWIGLAGAVFNLWSAWVGKVDKFLGMEFGPVWHYGVAGADILFLLVMFPVPKKGEGRFGKNDPWGEK